MLLLSGCGVQRAGVDVTQVPPDGWWQTIVVWPLAKALIWINDFLEGMNIPYSWGFAIILFTLIIKLITLPLTVTQMRGMQAQKRNPAADSKSCKRNMARIARRSRKSR